MTDIIPSVTVHPGELTEHPLNSNSHDRRNLEELAESRKQFGQFKNVVAWTPKEPTTVTLADGTAAEMKPGIMYVIAGNGFHQASILRGDEAIEVKDVSHLSHEDALSLMEADNASPLGSNPKLDQMLANMEVVRQHKPDAERLQAMLQRARELRGVSLNGKDDNARADTEPQIDKAEELRQKWGVELGQLWQLGEHRLICGDCTDAAVVARVMGGEVTTACVTDSPYGMNVDGITNDDEENLDVLFDGVLKCMPIVNGLCVNFQGCRLFWKWIDKAREHKHSIERSLWMYKPNDGTYPWRGWLQTGQIIIISSIGKPQWNDKGEYRHDTYVENFVGDELEKMHSTPKPVDIIQHIVSWVSIKSGIVYDPFLGSGTTMVAANNLGRRCYGIEIEPSYVAVTLERMNTLGVTPVLVEKPTG